MQKIALGIIKYFIEILKLDIPLINLQKMKKLSNISMILLMKEGTSLNRLQNPLNCTKIEFDSGSSCLKD